MSSVSSSSSLPPSVSSELIPPDFGWLNCSPISKFEPRGELSLPHKIYSDHIELLIENPDKRIIGSYNINHPSRHHYWRRGKVNPFSMVSPFTKKNHYRTEKHVNQIDVIAKRFVAGEVSIQVIVEASNRYLSELATKIESLGCKHFEIISGESKKLNDEEKKFQCGFTAILVNTSHFEVLFRRNLEEVYNEEGLKNSLRMTLPIVRVCDIKSKRITVVAGIHIPEVVEGVPKEGLQLVVNTLRNITSEFKEDTVVMTGDFNTIPIHTLAVMKNQKVAEEALLKVPYPTHVDFDGNAVVYDQAIVSGYYEPVPSDYAILPPESLNPFSQTLLRAIVRNRKHFLQYQLSKPRRSRKRDPVKLLRESV